MTEIATASASASASASATTEKLLYLDVDGPLNPYLGKPHRRPDGYITRRLSPDSWIAQHPYTPVYKIKPLRVWLSPGIGQWLRTFAEVYSFRLVWATSWLYDANTLIGPEIGLPELEVVDFPAMGCSLMKGFGPDETLWKTELLLKHASGRDFIWLDDQITHMDVAYAQRWHSGSSLIHFVDPAKGLLERDFAVMEAFVEKPHDSSITIFAPWERY